MAERLAEIRSKNRWPIPRLAAPRSALISSKRSANAGTRCAGLSQNGYQETSSSRRSTSQQQRPVPAIASHSNSMSLTSQSGHRKSAVFRWVPPVFRTTSSAWWWWWATCQPIHLKKTATLSTSIAAWPSCRCNWRS